MRLHFQEKPWDLYLSLGYTVLMTAVILVVHIGDLANVYKKLHLYVTVT